MDKIVYLNVLVLLGMMSMHAQQTLQLDSGKKSTNKLFEKDWSLISGSQKKTYKNPLSFESELKKHVKDLVYHDKIKAQTSRPRIGQMPIFKPGGNHPMKIYQPDSTSQYHLRIFRVD